MANISLQKCWDASYTKLLVDELKVSLMTIFVIFFINVSLKKFIQCCEASYNWTPIIELQKDMFL